MPETKPRTKKAKRAAMKQTMDEWKSGKLHSGSKTGPKVTSQKQVVAIGLSQSGQSNRSGSGRRKSSKQTSASRKKRLASVRF